MRRADREVKDFDQILDIMRGCDICELALNDVDGYPYVLPMNFGLTVENGKPVIYLHSAREGKKLDLIARDARCAFSMSRGHVLELAKVACATTWKYESVLGRGRISVVDDPAEGIEALKAIMRHYDPEHAHEFDERHLRAVVILRMDVEHLTGKRRDRK